MKRVTAYRSKEELVSPLVLALPKLVGQYNIDSDALDGQLGCFLPEEQKDIQQKSLG